MSKPVFGDVQSSKTQTDLFMSELQKLAEVGYLGL